MRKKMEKEKEKIRICFNCANFGNKRLTGDFNNPILDKKYNVKSCGTSPSRKRKCSECGQKTKSWVEENKKSKKVSFGSFGH